MKICLLCLLTLVSCHRPKSFPPMWQEVERLSWQDVDSASLLLSQIDTVSLSEAQRRYHQLLTIHTDFRRHPHAIGPEITSLAAYFERHNDAAAAGAAYYIKGAAEEWQGEVYGAMHSLKQAEHWLKQGDASAQWLGATCYKMGAISETEQLNEVALEYYLKAIPFLEQAGMPVFLTCAYRDAGRLTSGEDKVRYLNRAIAQAEQIKDKVFSYELRLIFLQQIHPEKLDEQRTIERLLVDSFGQVRYANPLVMDYLEEAQRDSVTYYLSIMAQDTSTMAWSRHRWHYLHSLLLLEDTPRAAYRELQHLYEEQIREAQQTGQSRTYAIARRYDLALEQDRNLRLTIRQQHAYLLIGVLIIVLLALSLWIVMERNRRRATQLKVSQMQAELDMKRNSLRRLLQQRVELAQKMQMGTIRGEQQALPEWVKQFVADTLWDDWTEFRQEFNDLYNDGLTHLKQRYPDLTPTDLQIIALMVIGLSISDICLLMNQTKNTIWSRRLRIKKHLGLTPEDDLNEWIKSCC